MARDAYCQFEGGVGQLRWSLKRRGGGEQLRGHILDRTRRGAVIDEGHFDWRLKALALFDLEDERGESACYTVVLWKALVDQAACDRQLQRQALAK